MGRNGPWPIILAFLLKVGAGYASQKEKGRVDLWVRIDNVSGLTNGSTLVHGLADDVHDAPKGLASYWHLHTCNTRQ